MTRTASLVAVFGMAFCTPASDPTASSVYTRLVEAGCLAPSADGVTSIAQEHAMSDPPGWLVCLYDGGTVQGCATPCQ